MANTEMDIVVDEVFTTFIDYWHKIKIEAKASDDTVADNGVQNDAFEWQSTPSRETTFDHYKEPVLPPNLANSLVQSATGGGNFNNIDAVWFSKHTRYGNGTVVVDETTNKRYKIVNANKFDPISYAEYQLKNIELQGGGNNDTDI